MKQTILSLTLLLLLLTAVSLRVSAQQRNSASIERTNMAKADLFMYEFFYNRYPQPGVVDDNRFKSVNHRIWSGDNVGGTPNLPAAKLKEFGQSLKINTWNLYDGASLVMKLTGSITIDKHLKSFVDTCPYAQHYIQSEYCNLSDHPTMLISEPVFGMRLLLTLDPKLNEEELRLHNNLNSYLVVRDISLKEFIKVEFERNYQNPEILDVTVLLSFQSHYKIKPSCEITSAILPADAFKYEHVTIPLEKGALNRRFTMGGSNLTLEDFAPGDVMISADTIDAVKIVDWRHIIVDGDRYMQPLDDGVITFPVPANALALGVKFAPNSYAHWLKINGLWNYIVNKGYSRQEIEDMWIVAGEDIAKYHAAVGYVLSRKMIGKYPIMTKELQERIVTQYPAVRDSVKLSGEWLDFDEPSYTRIVAMQYYNLNLEPDFEAIFRSAEENLAKPDRAKMLSYEDFMYDFSRQHKSWPIEKYELDYLFTALPEPEREVDPGLCCLWYKTGPQSTYFIFYTPSKDINLDSKIFEVKSIAGPHR